MSKRLATAGIVLACAFALGAEEILYQIDLVPSGRLVSRDLPVLKETTYVFHEFPRGTLISVRRSTVKQITRMSPRAAALVNPKTRLVRIGDLAFQGPRSGLTGGNAPSNMGRARDAVSAANAGTAARTGN
ncbi:MAG TPA: hypothetical protein VK389_08155 [Thermoanaerobaculia bacterium]|jgi:hypothetical protein|nr:hypothetical protein [Thermoanaerobaculia bacterium]